MIELKVCPFCGGVSDYYQISSGYGHGESYDEIGVKCRECGAKIGQEDYSGNKVDERTNLVTKKWNTRDIENVMDE